MPFQLPPMDALITSLPARILIAIANTTVPHDRRLPRLQREALKHAFRGKARTAPLGCDPVQAS